VPTVRSPWQPCQSGRKGTTVSAYTPQSKGITVTLNDVCS
jgi:hypothetical protein